MALPAKVSLRRPLGKSGPGHLQSAPTVCLPAVRKLSRRPDL